MPGVEVPGSRVPNESCVTAMASEGVAQVADSHPAAPAVVDVAVVKGPVVMNIHVDMSVPPADRPPPGRPESVARKPEHEPAGNTPLEPSAEAIRHRRADPHRTKVRRVLPARPVHHYPFWCHVCPIVPGGVAGIDHLRGRSVHAHVRHIIERRAGRDGVEHCRDRCGNAPRPGGRCGHKPDAVLYRIVGLRVHADDWCR